MKQLITLLILVFVSGVVFSQRESDKLKAKQRDLEKKISYTKQLIGETKNQERLAMVELGIINQQIAYRDELISLYGQQVVRLERKISMNREVIESLEEDLQDLKERYAKMIYFAYKNRNDYDAGATTLWMSGEELNQAYLRMKYLNKIAEYRKLQAKFIKDTQKALAGQQTELENNILEKQKVLRSKDEEKRKYQDDKGQRRNMLVSLKQEEQKLKNQLDDQQEKKRRLAAAIKKAIEKEIAAQAKANNSGNFSSTPEASRMGKTFAANKGRLPWPVIKGEITGKFGKQPHPVIAGVYTQNNGVDISTTKDAAMRAVFEGEVTSVFVIPGAGKAVMVSHGTYRTVYANLREAFVSKGDKVSSKQQIGILLTESSTAISEAHFEIWHVENGRMDKLNPAYWLSR